MEKLTSDTFNRWKDWTEKIKIDLQEIIDYQQVYEYFIEVVNANIQHIKDIMASYFVISSENVTPNMHLLESGGMLKSKKTVFL